MNKILFSATLFSSVLLIGTAFSMEDSETEPSQFGGKLYGTPLSKAEIDKFKKDYPNTALLKQGAREEVGDLSNVSVQLANLLIEDAEQEAFRKRENRLKELNRFLAERERARKLNAAKIQSEQELKKELEQIREYTQFVKKDIEAKLQEIATLSNSSDVLRSELSKAQSMVKSLEEATSEDSAQIEYYKKRVSSLSKSLLDADERQHQLEEENSQLVHNVGVLTLQRDSTKSLLKAYSPLKKVLASANAPAVVAFTTSDVDGSTQVPGQENKDKDDEKSDSDSDFDLDA